MSEPRAERVVTPEEADRHYKGLLDSVQFITERSNIDSLMSHETPVSRAEAVERNVKHLELMVAKTFWTEQHDMTAVNAAIEQGNAFVAAHKPAEQQ